MAIEINGNMIAEAVVARLVDCGVSFRACSH